ncbi:MAG TPA: tryptophan 2,3-dioxygenase family protein [Bdellovibrionales bacterium]|nr:tryptophan 2,3-dioxygenase family protein [Bdellovibrionales bacterium]
MTKKPNEDFLSSLTSYSTSQLTYNDYLKVPELLSLQRPQSEPAHHDEMLFIIIHQAYELWFKLILHEMETALELMEQKNILRANHFMTRVVEIFRILIPQIHILETMTPAEFLQFRGKLNPASGFQSIQFREVEFLAGLRDERYLAFFKDRPEMRERLIQRMKEPSLRDAYYKMLKGLGFDLPEDTSLEAFNTKPEVREKILATLSMFYRYPEKQMPLYLLTESLVDLDEHLALWRDHHVRVVERIIGFKTGTGGSSGASYLQSTTRKQCFPCLWQVRTVL